MAFPALWLGVFYVLDNQPPIDARWAVTEAERAVDRAETPGAIVGPWEDTAIPGAHALQQAPFVSVWYRFDAAVPADGGIWGVYLAAPQANVRVFVNGIRVLSTGPIEAPLAFFREPLLAPFDARLATRPTDRVHVHLTRERHDAGTAAVYVGPIEALQPTYDSLLFFTQTLPALISAFLITVVVLLLALTLMRPQESAYGWFALTLVLWTGHTLCQLVDNIPFDHWRWVGLWYALTAWVLTVVIAFNRFYGFQARSVERVLLVTAVPLLAGIVWVSGSEDQALMFQFYDGVWLPYLLLWAFYTLLQHGYAIYRGPSVENVSLMLHGLGAMALGVRDYLFDIGVPWVPGTTYYLPLYAAFTLLFPILLVVRRYIITQRRVDGFTDELRRQVEETSARLEANYRELSELAQQQAIAQERGRIMRDMHDGLGGQLMHALALAEEAEPHAADGPDGLQGTLQRALQDLRFIIDSLSPDHRDVTALLAGFRHRSRPMLEQAGVRIVWQVDELPETVLPPASALHLLRILQETVTNTVRHARATCLEFRGYREHGRICIEVNDDGTGFAMERVNQRGLNNMRFRGGQIGAEVTVVSGVGGTSTRILLPADVDSPGLAPDSPDGTQGRTA